MKKKELVGRWTDQLFVERMHEVVRNAFVEKNATDADLSGLVVGLDGAIESLIHSDLQDARLVRVKFSFSKFSCSFNRCNCVDVSFDEARFDTCRFKDSRFECCSFKKVRLDSPTLDDAVFVECSFHEAQIKGRGWNEYGGKRVTFERCRFDGCVFRNLQLRACKFIGCTFDNVTFSKCLMSGVSFSECSPDIAAFEGCELNQCVHDGTALVA